MKISWNRHARFTVISLRWFSNKPTSAKVFRLETTISLSIYIFPPTERSSTIMKTKRP